MRVVLNGFLVIQNTDFFIQMSKMSIVSISSTLITLVVEYVYVIAREGVKFGINFTSCSENGNEIA